ncbi:MAG: hypothetical protein GKR90_05020 [Pseudomonadales bacterium]|nr:hypothetical protein [Pseudomonadales bacterium]
MPKLYLRVLSDARAIPDEEEYEISLEWLITENDGGVRGYGRTDQRGLADVADPNVEWLNDPDNTTVFVPSDFVLKVACEVPGRSQAQIRRALPFAVEEYIASDIESMHIAHGPIKAGEPIHCNLLSREQIDNWLACFTSVGVHPGAFIADAEILDQNRSVATLVFDDDSVLVNNASQAAVVGRDNLSMALGTLAIDRIISLNGVPTDLELGQIESSVAVEEVSVTEAGVIEYFAKRHRTGESYVNLLQGEYRPHRPQSANATRWRGVFALAAGWLVVGFVSLVVQGWWASSEAERLERLSFDFYKQTFPRESQPVSIDQLRRRMASKLGQASPGAEGSESAFIGLTAQFANVAKAEHSVLSMSYTEQRRELNVEILLKNYDELDAYKTQLAAQGIEVETTNAEQETRGVRTRMRVRYAG